MKDYFIIGLILCLSSVTLYATAEEPVPSCVEDKITVQKLTQENAQLAQQNARLLQQLMPTQFQAAEKAAEAAKAEQTRLEALLPKKPEEKGVTTVTPDPAAQE